MENFLRRLIQYARKNYLSYWFILGIDTIISVACSLIVYFLTFLIIDAPINILVGGKLFLISFLVSLLGSSIFRTYRNTIRFSQTRETWRIMASAAIKVISFILIVTFLLDISHPYKFIIIASILFDGLLTLVVMMTFRMLLILTYETLLNWVNKKNMRILIYGIDEKSVGLKIRLKDSEHYRVAGFCVNGTTNNKRRLADFPIYCFTNESDFKSLIEKKGIKGIIFARYEDTRLEENRLLIYCKKYAIKTLISPTISEADSNGNFHQFVRPIKIEDLLGREQININEEKVAEEFKGKVVLVTGAAGSIGSELCRQILKMDIKKLILFDSAETPLHNIRLEFEKNYPQMEFVPIIGDVRVKERVRMVFETYHPQIVFHAAAYKHVPLMEENPCEAILVNVIGSRQVADMAVEYNAEKMIMVSTDKAVNPTNVMGASKRLAEIYIQSLGCAIKDQKIQGKTKFITTRFGNVLGSNGSVIPLFKSQIENGGPITVTHPDIIRFFMTIPEACSLVLEAATLGEGNEIFVFEMGEAVKIVDLAIRMIELAGYKPDVDIKIEFTGLRPGEKLYEEVLSDEENTIPTDNSKIMIAKVRRYEYTDILESYKQFEVLSRHVDVDKAVQLMKQIVPEFVSKNSKFEKFDLKK